MPLAGRSAGYLLAITSAGMLTGDILIGRFVSAGSAARWSSRCDSCWPRRTCCSCSIPARRPAALGFLASIGYAASLPLQERLVARTSPRIRGQVLGLYSAGVTAMQGVAAVLAGLLTERLAGGPAAAIGVLGCASLVITVALIPGLRRTRPRRPRASADDIEVKVSLLVVCSRLACGIRPMTRGVAGLSLMT